MQPEEAPLMVYWSERGWRVWTREHATKCLREGFNEVGRNWSEEGRGAGARLIPREFALLPGRFGGGTKLAASGASPWVIKREGRGSSDAFIVYVRVNMEDPEWVSRTLVSKADGLR